MMISTSSFARDDFSFRIPIAFPGATVNLSGATVEAFASRAGRGPAIAAEASMSGTAEAIGVFEAGTLAPGVYLMQVRATLGETTQTLAQWSHTVLESIAASSPA